jgi:putative transposase
MMSHTTFVIRRQGYVFRLTPTAAQDNVLRQFVGCSRLVWNAILAENQFRYDAGDPLPIGRKSFCNRLLELKARFPFLRDVHSQPLQQTLNDLVEAYQRAFDPELAAKPPTFKRKNDAQGIRFPQGFRLENKRVYLPKIGWLGFRCSRRTMKRKIAGKIKSVTIRFDGGRWFVSFATERDVEAPVHPMMGEVVGIDFGIQRWAALADGAVFDGANAFKRYERRLALLQQRLARKTKFSQNWFKAKRAIAKLHTKIANVRKDQIHQATSTISKNHAVVVVEDLRISNMTRNASGTIEQPGTNVAAKSGLNRRIADQAWGEAARQLGYKLAWVGGLLVRVNPCNTSRECSNCHHISADNRQTQADFVCVRCGHATNADTNAAANIEGRAGWARIVCGDRRSKQKAPCAA